MKNIILLLCMFSSITHADGYPKPQTPSELHSLFGKYFISKDLNGLGSLFDDNAIFVTDTEGNLVKGRDDILIVLNKYMDAGSEMETVSVSIHINGNIAQIKSVWKIVGSEITGTAMEVMEYKNGGWLYIIDNPNGF